MSETQSQSVFQPLIPKHLLTMEDLCFLLTFHIDAEDLESGHYRLYALEWCTEGYDTENMDEELDEKALFERFQEIIRRSNGALPWISKETCYFSEGAVPGDDEVGGSSVFITADKVVYDGTGSWLERMGEAFHTGCPDTPDPEENESVRSLTVNPLIYQGTAGKYSVHAELAGDTGIYDELRVGIMNKDGECVGDAYFTLNEQGEPRILLTPAGEIHGDPTLVFYPLRVESSIEAY